MAPQGYQAFLRDELARRRKLNSKYSLRAFARALGFDAGAFSRVLSGKRPLSFRRAVLIANRLVLPTESRTRFLESVIADHRKRLDPQSSKEEAIEPIDNDLFRIIGDWYHYAILELTFTKSFRPSPVWIAKSLGISRAECLLAIARLTKVGLLKREGRRLRKNPSSVTTSDKTSTTPFLRQHQRQMFEKAIFSLENDPFEERSLTGMTMAIDPKHLGKAREMIDAFTQELRRTLEQGSPQRVYQLSVGLFPLQTKETSK